MRHNLVSSEFAKGLIENVSFCTGKYNLVVVNLACLNSASLRKGDKTKTLIVNLCIFSFLFFFFLFFFCTDHVYGFVD